MRINLSQTADFKQKVDIFNYFFANQSTLVENGSKLLLDRKRKTRNSLSTNEFVNNDIAKNIKILDSNKAHGHVMISIGLLKMCVALFPNLLNSCLDVLLRPVYSPLNGEKRMLSLCTKNMINDTGKLSTNFFATHLWKNLRRVLVIKCMIFLMKATYPHQIN